MAEGQYVTGADIALKIKLECATGNTFADLARAIDIVCERLGSRDDDQAVTALREVASREANARSEPPTGDQEAAEALHKKLYRIITLGHEGATESAIAEISAALSTARGELEGAAREVIKRFGSKGQRHWTGCIERDAALQRLNAALTPEGVKPMSIRKEVMAFAYTMEGNLAARDKARGAAGWKNEPLDYLLTRLDEEVAELRGAVKGGAGKNTIKLEAADVGNLAMMVADVAAGWAGKTPEEAKA